MCGEPKCGDCSVKRDGRRTCLDCVARKNAEDERLRLEAQAHAERQRRKAREEQEARDNEPVDMDEVEAFDVLFLRDDVTMRQVNSAARLLKGLSPSDFAAVAIMTLKQEGTRPYRPTKWRGGRRSLLQRSMAQLYSFPAWRFSWGDTYLQPNGQWLQHYRYQEEWRSSSGYLKREPEVAELVAHRKTLLTHVLRDKSVDWEPGVVGAQR